MKTPYRVLIRKSDLDFFDVHDLPETMEDLGNGFIASYLTEEQYRRQLCNPDALWKCPIPMLYENVQPQERTENLTTYGMNPI